MLTQSVAKSTTLGSTWAEQRASEEAQRGRQKNAAHEFSKPALLFLCFGSAFHEGSSKLAFPHFNSERLCDGTLFVFSGCGLNCLHKFNSCEAESMSVAFEPPLSDCNALHDCGTSLRRVGAKLLS